MLEQLGDQLRKCSKNISILSWTSIKQTSYRNELLNEPEITLTVISSLRRY